MADRDITLWIDERWYDALNRHIHGETLQCKLEDYLDELVNKLLPEDEYEQISREIYAERMEREAQRKADQRFAVFRIWENGEKHCCLVDEPINFLVAAHSLRRYVRSDTEASFRNYYAAAQEISGREFTQYARDRLENTGHVVGAYDVDLDKGTVAELNQDGWYLYTLRDVCTAAYHADRKSQESSCKRMEHFLNFLRGKTLPQQGRYTNGFCTFGTREPRKESVSFAGEIGEVNGKLDFYMESFAGLDDVLGTHACTEENDDYVNVYANYDLEHGTVTDTLSIILHRADGSDEQHEYHLSPVEQTILLLKMDAYCQAQMGMSLEVYRERYLAEQKRVQSDTLPEMTGPTM